MKGILFDTFHSFDNFALILTSKTIGQPVVKTEYVEVLGADGQLDLTEAFGEVKYLNRKLTFVFSIFEDANEWAAAYSRVLNNLHGKKMKIVLDDDPEFYYIGRVNVSDYISAKRIGNITIEVDAEPYKYKQILTIVTNTVSGTLTVNYTNLRKSNLDDGILVLVNKHYYLDKDYTPSLVSIDYNYGSGMLTSEAYNAFKKLSDAARSEGLYILSRSPYRSYATQYSVYNQYKNNKGQDWADRWSARPGHSEHQTGLAVDVKTYTTNELNDFTYTREYQWMKQNAHLYGFILRYPEGKEYITGYGAESWHYRFVGVTAAQIMYNENLTFEEYHAYYVKKEA